MDRNFQRPASIYNSLYRGVRLGFWPWIPAATNPETENYYMHFTCGDVSGAPIDFIPSQRVLKASEALGAFTAHSGVLNELLDVPTELTVGGGSYRVTAKVLIAAAIDLMDGGVFTITTSAANSIGTLVATHLHFSTNLPAEIAKRCLPQSKKRRGGLWIPAKRTRSNAVAFTRIRVPHK